MVKEHRINYLIFFSLILIVLFIRIGNLNFIDGRYLWAEDGNIFINQALSLKWESIFKTYNGYIHLYPRLISLFAVQLNLVFLPIVFFVAWIVAVLYSSFVIFKWLYKQTDSIIIAMFVPLLVLLQPNSGEVFFTITNSQWFLSLALIILLIDKEYKVNYKNFFVLILLGLTGPFSVLILPILFFSIIIRKDLKENYLKYLIILSTALIQVYFIANSNRVGGDVDTNIFHWLKSFFIFITFGTKGFFAILSILIWLTLFIYLIKFFYDVYKKRFTDKQINGLILLMGLFILYFAGLWSAKQLPYILNPIGGGARYFVVPYALLFISLPLFINQKKILYGVLFLIFIVCVQQFTKVERPSLNYQSFIWFAQYNKKLNIPISPQWETYPGWHIEIKNYKIKSVKPIIIPEKNISLINAVKSGNSFESINNDMQLLFDVPVQCKYSPHIGVEVDLNRADAGWSQIFYANSSNVFSEKNSLRRYYPSGSVIMHFAFRNKNITKIRIDPTEQQEQIKIEAIKLYCDINDKSK